MADAVSTQAPVDTPVQTPPEPTSTVAETKRKYYQANVERLTKQRKEAAARRRVAEASVLLDARTKEVTRLEGELSAAQEKAYFACAQVNNFKRALVSAKAALKKLKEKHSDAVISSDSTTTESDGQDEPAGTEEPAAVTTIMTTV